jgi:hypothetical protein
MKLSFSAAKVTPEKAFPFSSGFFAVYGIED